MTKERVEEIKAKTIFRAGKKVKNLDFDSKEHLIFELGEIFGELNRDLTRELNKELDKPILSTQRNNNSSFISTTKNNFLETKDKIINQ